MKRAAQNFKLKLKSSSSGSDSSSSSSDDDDTTSDDTTDNKEDTTEEKPVVVQNSIVKKIEPVVKKTSISTLIDNKKAVMDGRTKEMTETITITVAGIPASLSLADAPIILEFYATGLTDGISHGRFNLSGSSLKEIAEKDISAVRFNLGALGTVTLSKAALDSILLDGIDDFEIVLIKDGTEVIFNLMADGEIINDIDDGVKVTFPTSVNGEVIVLVKMDNKEIGVKKSAVEDGNVYALLKGSGRIKVINNSKKFSDVSRDRWYNSAVLFVSSRELFIGVNDTEFMPELKMTRAMFTTILHRLENSEEVDVNTTFSDVLLKQWYSDGVLWAAASNIISGYGDGLLEQMQT